MNIIKKIVWIFGAILFFIWLFGMSFSITIFPIYLTYKMVMASGFQLWGFIKILGGSLVVYFGFAAMALDQYMLLMTHNWVTE